MTSYMEDLRGFLVDEQRPVTYGFLSSTLSVPADTAKRMLYHFAQENTESVQATYLISGWVKGSQGSERKRLIKLVGEVELEKERGLMDQVVCTHVFSLVPKGAIGKSAEELKTPPRKSMLASMLWAADHEAKEQQYAADAAVTNCLRDNRHSHIKYPKAVRDLKPKQLFPQSPMPAMASSSAAAGSSSKPASSASKPAAAAAPKLSASEQAFKDRQDKGASKPAAAAPAKLSAAELRMKEIAEGKGPAAKMNTFFGSGQAGKSKAGGKSKASAKKEAQKEEEAAESADSEDDERFKKKEVAPVLDFTFDDEEPAGKKKASPAKKAAGKRKPAAKGGNGKKKDGEDDFINDASSESEEAAESEEDDEEKKKKPMTRRKRLMQDSDSEDNDAVGAKGGGKGEEDKTPKYSFKKKAVESDSGGDSGDDSDSSCASQHTNASDPDVEKVEKKEKDAGGSGESDSDEDMPSGKLVIKKKDGSKVVKKGSKRKAGEEGEEEEGEDGEGKKKKRKSRKKKNEGSDDESPSKPKGRKRKEIEVDYNQRTLDPSMFAGEAAAKESGPVRRKKKVEKTYLDDKGYLVTEEVWEDDSDAEGAEEQGEADKCAGGKEGDDVEAPSEKKAKSESKPKAPAAAAAPKKPAAPKKEAVKNDAPKQASMMSFFSKK